MTGAREAFGFLTSLGGARAPSPAAVAWFPVVGLAVGLGLGGAWHVAELAWPPLVAAVLVVTIDLGLTGMLHVDGLADAADGLLPHMEQRRRLQVMAEPSVGAFAVVVVTAALLLRVSSLSSIGPAPLLLAGLWCLSRSAMALTIARVRYARDGGLATAFRGGSVIGPASAGLVVAVLAAVAWAPAQGAASVAVAAVAFAAVIAIGVRRVGGYTGDVLGAAGVVSETCGLLVAAARW